MVETVKQPISKEALASELKGMHPTAEMAGILATISYVERMIAKGKGRDFFENMVSNAEKGGNKDEIRGAEISRDCFSLIIIKEKPTEEPKEKPSIPAPLPTEEKLEAKPGPKPETSDDWEQLWGPPEEEPKITKVLDTKAGKWKDVEAEDLGQSLIDSVLESLEQGETVLGMAPRVRMVAKRIAEKGEAASEDTKLLQVMASEFNISMRMRHSPKKMSHEFLSASELAGMLEEMGDIPVAIIESLRHAKTVLRIEGDEAKIFDPFASSERIRPEEAPELIIHGPPLDGKMFWPTFRRGTVDASKVAKGGSSVTLHLNEAAWRAGLDKLDLPEIDLGQVQRYAGDCGTAAIFCAWVLWGVKQAQIAGIRFEKVEQPVKEGKEPAPGIKHITFTKIEEPEKKPGQASLGVRRLTPEESAQYYRDAAERRRRTQEFLETIDVAFPCKMLPGFAAPHDELLREWKGIVASAKEDAETRDVYMRAVFSSLYFFDANEDYRGALFEKCSSIAKISQKEFNKLLFRWHNECRKACVDVFTGKSGEFDGNPLRLGEIVKQMEPKLKIMAAKVAESGKVIPADTKVLRVFFGEFNKAMRKKYASHLGAHDNLWDEEMQAVLDEFGDIPITVYGSRKHMKAQLGPGEGGKNWLYDPFGGIHQEEDKAGIGDSFGQASICRKYASPILRFAPKPPAEYFGLPMLDLGGIQEILGDCGPAAIFAAWFLWEVKQSMLTKGRDPDAIANIGVESEEPKKESRFKFWRTKD